MAFNINSVSEFERAQRSGQLNRMINQTMSEFTGRRFNIRSAPAGVRAAMHSEIRNHLVFDLINYHEQGRSESLF